LDFAVISKDQFKSTTYIS